MKTFSSYRFKLLAVPLALMAVALMMLSWGHGTSGEAEAVNTSGQNFSMSISGCAEGTVTTKGGDAKCSLATSSTFTVNFDLNALPALPDTDSDSINGYTQLKMTATFSGVQYKTASFTALHGDSSSCTGPLEPPLGTLVPNGIHDCVGFGNGSCTSPDVPHASTGDCEATDKGLTVWTADFNCGQSGFVQLEHPFVDIEFPATNLPTSVRDDGILSYHEADPERISVNCTAAVGGLAVDLDGDLGDLPLDVAEPPGGNTGVLAGVVAAIAAGTVTLGGAAWYTRRRWAR